MELLYLWIDDYKNIKQQGFNFSPLYEFEFTPTDFDKDGKVIGGKLEDKMDLKEGETKEKFYKDFFGEGISNVTAIVGENGAGKSSVLELLNKISARRSLDINCIAIVGSANDNGSKSYFSYKPKRIKITSFPTFDGHHTPDDFESDQTYLPLNLISYSYYLKNFNSYKNYVEDKKRDETFKDVSSNSLFYSLVEDNKQGQSILNEDILTMFEIQKIYDQCKFLHKVKFDLFKLNSLRIQIRQHRTHITKNIDSSDEHDYQKYCNLYHDLFDDVDISQSISSSSDFIDKIYLQTYISIAQSLSNYQRFKELQRFKNNKISLAKKIVKYSQKVDKIISDHKGKDKKRFQKILNKLATLSNNNKDIQDFSYPQSKLKHLSELIKILKKIEKPNPQEDKSTLSISLENKIFNNFFEKYLEFGFNLFDFNFEKDSQIQYLSTGEDAILFQLASFFKAQENIKCRANSTDKKAKFNEPYYILIDEGELGLHPQWQKQYLKTLLETLPKIFPNKQIQLILTSHSPFLVSDLPKENVIFLEKEKGTGLCKVSKLDSMKETFGANIHTLLTDSFFMKGGLVGEFAQSKIDEVIKLLDKSKLEKEEIEHCEMIISMIGEPIVKTML